MRNTITYRKTNTMTLKKFLCDFKYNDMNNSRKYFNKNFIFLKNVLSLVV